MWSKIPLLLKRYVDSHGFKNEIHEAQMRLVWKDVVRELYPPLVLMTKMKSFQKNILTVLVGNHIWLTELEANKELLCQKLKKKSSHHIKNIRFYYSPPTEEDVS